jgi:hypothetical protein
MDRKEILQRQFETLDWRAIYQEVEQKNDSGLSWTELRQKERRLRRQAESRQESILRK